MSLDKPPIIEKIHPKRRITIGAYVVATQLMQNLYPQLQDVVLQQPPDAYAKAFLKLIHEQEFLEARNSVADVAADSNQHIAFQQMRLTSKTFRHKLGHTSVVPNGDFIVASHYLEDVSVKEKIDAELGIADLINEKLPYGAAHYFDIAKRNVELSQSTVDVRRAVAYTVDDATYWLGSR